MRRYFILTALCLFTAMGAMAQDDDMYFTPKKGSAAQARQSVPLSQVSGAYDYNGGNEGVDVTTHPYSSARDVDEYNRRNRPGMDYSAAGDGLTGAEDSILISRQDYENSLKMQRFDGFRSTIVVMDDPWWYDPWWYDPWYSSSYYWRTRWHDPWYWGYHDPWRWSYYSSWYGWGGWHGWGHPWYGPAYHRPIWSGGVRSTYRGGYGSGRWATTRRVENGGSRTYRGGLTGRTGDRSIGTYPSTGRRQQTTTRTRPTTTTRTRPTTTTRSNSDTQTTPSRSYSNGSSTRSFGGSSHSYSSGSRSFGGGGGGSRTFGGGSRSGRR